MNCANHPDRERVAFCQHCGKPLCQECARVVGTAVFCEPCLASRLAGASSGTNAGMPASDFSGAPIPPPSQDLPSPALATLLGFLPGVGAMYNGQYAKGIVHLIVFAVLASIGGIFKLFALGWIIYQAIEANHTARARLAGAPLPNPFGLNDIGERLGFGRSWPVPPPPTAGFGTQPTTGQPAPGRATFTADPGGNVAYTAPTPVAETPIPRTPPASGPGWSATSTTPPPQPPAQPSFTPFSATNEPGFGETSYSSYSNASSDPFLPQRNRFPAGAIWLIGIGSIFLLGNLGLFHEFPARYLVPILLLGFGAWLFLRRMTLPEPGESYNLRVFRALRGSIWVIMTGLLMLLDVADILSWAHSWPLYIIAAGLMALLHNVAYSGASAMPYPAATDPAPSTIVPGKTEHEGHEHEEER